MRRGPEPELVSEQEQEQERDWMSWAGAGCTTDTLAGVAITPSIALPTLATPFSLIPPFNHPSVSRHHSLIIHQTRRLTKLHYKGSPVDMHRSLNVSTHAKGHALLVQYSLVEAKPARNLLLVLRGAEAKVGKLQTGLQVCLQAVGGKAELGKFVDKIVDIKL
jgi:hypothetical protein